MLSAGNDINDVSTEARTADKLSFMNLEVDIIFYSSSEIIYLDANWPIFIKITLKIVILIPVHSEDIPYCLIIIVNASRVFLYMLLPLLIEACLLTKATSKGFPTKAPKAPLAIASSTFYTLFVSLFFVFK